MKARRLILILVFTCFSFYFLPAQCSICTKTAEQLGEGPAKGLNKGIVYLMFTPLIIMGFVGFRWWQREKKVLQAEKEQ
jgi:hypothetical protein